MTDSVPGSPVPSSNNIASTERTRLLNTTSANYQTRQEESSTSQTIITMDTTINDLNGSGTTTMRQIKNVSLAGQPTIPLNQLTEKIQDILVFSEIRQKQQERAMIDQKKKQQKAELAAAVAAAAPASSSSSSSSSSDSDSDSGSARLALKKKLSEWSIHGSKHKDSDGKRLRKRDYAVDALKFATDNWKAKHGYATGSNNSSFASLPGANTATAIGSSHHHGTNTVKQSKYHEEPLSKGEPSTAESVFDVAKNASVCAVLALLHERRQSSGHSTETDISLQSLALSTLNLGLKAQEKSTKHVVLYEILTNKWLNNKSALEWAVENNSQLILNDARVQLVIEDLWKYGPNWRQDPSHPSYIWLQNTAEKQEDPKNFVRFIVCRTFTDFLARWPSARYQTLIAVFSWLVYLGFHLATISNLEYTSDVPFVFEYIYYVFVISDLLLAFFKLATSPFTYLKKVSSYISLITVTLLVSSFIIRIFTLLAVDNIEDEYYFLTVSFTLLVLATPLMFFRMFAVSSDICWSTAKTSYILHQCFINSIWVFVVGIFIILGFWAALGALQFDDVHPLAMLRFLVLGALHAPQIGDTLYYQPQAAGLLLAIYLFLTVIVLGSLLVASFLSTFLDINNRIDSVKRDWAIRRCLGSNAILNVFLPSLFIDMIFGIARWFARVVFKRSSPVAWIGKAHQVLWYIIYSPIILLVGLYELVTAVLFKWKLVSAAFKRDTTTTTVAA